MNFKCHIENKSLFFNNTKIDFHAKIRDVVVFPDAVVILRYSEKSESNKDQGNLLAYGLDGSVLWSFGYNKKIKKHFGLDGIWSTPFRNLGVMTS